MRLFIYNLRREKQFRNSSADDQRRTIRSLIITLQKMIGTYEEQTDDSSLWDEAVGNLSDNGLHNTRVDSVKYLFGERVRVKGTAVAGSEPVDVWGTVTEIKTDGRFFVHTTPNSGYTFQIDDVEIERH